MGDGQRVGAAPPFDWVAPDGCLCDAIAFRVVGGAQAEQIYAKIASLPGLRPHRFILANYPSYDDMYEKPEGLWAFGTWVNGGHWSTCEARMMLG